MQAYCATSSAQYHIGSRQWFVNRSTESHPRTLTAPAWTDIVHVKTSANFLPQPLTSASLYIQIYDDKTIARRQPAVARTVRKSLERVIGHTNVAAMHACRERERERERVTDWLGLACSVQRDRLPLCRYCSSWFSSNRRDVDHILPTGPTDLLAQYSYCSSLNQHRLSQPDRASAGAVNFGSRCWLSK